MSYPRPVRFTRVAAIIAAIVVSAVAARAQDNPYRVVEGWPQLPASVKWGAVISVDSDAKGNIWVFHRNQPPILKFDPSGKMLTSFGADMFVQPHGMTVDRDGNLWVTDGHVANSNGRVVKFSKDGKFIKAWGKKGSGTGEFDTPHSIAMDSRGRLFVADRGNNRIQIFDQEGRFLDQWKQFGRPSGVFIDKNDTIYVADSQSNATLNPGFKRGIRIGSAKDGKVTALIPFAEAEPDKNNN